METKSYKSSNPSHIPVEPVIYALLSQGFCDDNLKEIMLEAIHRYNNTCEEAYSQLIIDLQNCLKKQ